MGTLANSKDPDEMQHRTAFYQGLHYLLKSKQPPGTEIHSKNDFRKKIMILIICHIYQKLDNSESRRQFSLLLPANENAE